MRHSLADTRLLNILAVCMERLDRVLSARAGFRSGEEVSLYRLRYNFNMQQATDRRDLIYGLLGLVNDWGSVAPITPDYSKATSPSVLACGVGDGGIKSSGGSAGRTLQDIQSIHRMSLAADFLLRGLLPVTVDDINNIK
ncbi:hypothetical protein B0J12DRAFT_757484 [Macrophomina phaseolina]|uniref:Uncharacterized protein n=1 Tax=Macrophomina phaseolina TaxID=35725 RepID=A0ABQ8G6F3_9PEZI|nr:hypothetical protein B0J12DRAFT_757484 [Macrophomina phaseolina]